MIALKTEAACGACPLSMLCLQGKKLAEVLSKPRQARFRRCRRCSCVLFEYVSDDNKTETFLCGHIRYSLHWSIPAGIRDGSDSVWNAFGVGLTVMRGCGLSLPRLHTTQREYLPERLNYRGDLERDSARRFDKRDCFYHYRASIREVI